MPVPAGSNGCRCTERASSLGAGDLNSGMSALVSRYVRKGLSVGSDDCNLLDFSAGDSYRAGATNR